MKRVLLASLLVGAFLTAKITAGDWSPSPVTQWLVQTPKPITPKVQEDDFSCGFLALSSIYQSYGLDAEQARLRERLGTNIPAIPFIKSSNGTLQPDLFRVLKQDGFRVETLNPKNPMEIQLLKDHLQGPHYALALVSTARAGGLHWIVFTDFDDTSGAVTIADSLQSNLQEQPLSELVDTTLIRALLLQPGSPDPNGSYGAAHWIGTQEMLFTLTTTQKILISVILLALLAASVFIVLRLAKFIANLRRKRG
ncbi:MAG: hypothetical protein ACSHYB_14035 [Roseibacillus sp.]